MSGETEPDARPTQRTIVFILQLWTERTAAKGIPAIWRFSVRDVRTGTRRGFASLDDFVAYLEFLCGEESEL